MVGLSNEDDRAWPAHDRKRKTKRDDEGGEKVAFLFFLSCFSLFFVWVFSWNMYVSVCICRSICMGWEWDREGM